MGKYIRWIHWWLAIWSNKQIPTNPYKHFMGCILCIIITCPRQPLLHTCNYFRGRHLIMVDMKLVAGFPYLSLVPAIQRKDESDRRKSRYEPYVKYVYFWDMPNCVTSERGLLNIQIVHRNTWQWYAIQVAPHNLPLMRWILMSVVFFPVLRVYLISRNDS